MPPIHQNPYSPPAKDNPVKGGEEFHYRSVCKSAVATFVFSVLGLLAAFLSPVFVLLPALGVGFGIVAIANFRRYPEELVGKKLAQVGLIISSICLFCSIGMHAYIYATEVPDGYQRISYSMLRDNRKTPLPFSEQARDLDGKKVFLKGYVRPSNKTHGLKNFILVGDWASCCFGGNPKITDVVAVRIKTDETVSYDGFSLKRIGGVFRLNQQAKRINEKDVPQVFYEIEADHVK